MESNQLAQLSLNHSLAGMIFFDPVAMQILLLNQQAANFLEVENQESWRGRSILEFLGPDQNTDTFKKDDFYGELTLLRLSGTIFPVSAIVRHLPGDTKMIGIFSFQDISAQKKIMRDLNAKHEGLREILEELTAKNKELELLDKAKTKFLSLVAHELRTPLNTILATTELLQEKMQQGDAEMATLAKNMYQQSHHMMELVNDILDLTKIQSGKMELYISEGQAFKTLLEKLPLFAEYAARENVKLEAIPPVEEFVCYFDPLRWGQIISNLISNGIKFNKPGGHLRITAKQDEDYVEIQFADEGIGVAPDKQEAIFNEFETIEDLAHHHKGTGLGLSIVRSLVRGQGGDIRMESTLGKGSSFFVKFPRKKILEEALYRSRLEEEVLFF